MLNSLASSKLQQMAKGIAKFKSKKMRSKSQRHWFCNEILLKKYLGSQAAEPDNQKGCAGSILEGFPDPSGYSPEQPDLSSLLTCSEQEVEQRTSQGLLQSELSYDPSSIFVFRSHSIPNSNLSTITRTAEVFEKNHPVSLTLQISCTNIMH